MSIPIDEKQRLGTVAQMFRIGISFYFIKCRIFRLN